MQFKEWFSWTAVAAVLEPACSEGVKVSGLNGTAAWGARIYGDGRLTGGSADRMERVVLKDRTGEQRAPGTKVGGRSLSWKCCARSGGTHAREACAGGGAVILSPRED